jgi:predicted nucleic acid-binding protein
MTVPFLDTNIVIDWMVRKPAAIVELQRYRQHRISRIVWAELLAGEPAESHDALRRLLARFAVVEVDEEIAALAAAFRNRTRVKLLDSLIYATAQRHGGLLVTRNTKDFPPHLPGIHVPYTL